MALSVIQRDVTEDVVRIVVATKRGGLTINLQEGDDGFPLVELICDVQGAEPAISFVDSGQIETIRATLVSPNPKQRMMLGFYHD